MKVCAIPHIFAALFLSAALMPVSVFADLNLDLPDFNLPDLGDPSVSALPNSEERDRGLIILRKLRSRGSLIEDPEINTWIRSLGNRLAARAPQTGNPFYFVVSKDKSINAFATIGGVVLINAGLIMKTDSESELAAVLSHEIAHVTQRHIARMIAKSKEDALGRSAAVLAGVVAGTRNPELGQALITGALATGMHKQLSFSREAESEADRVGLRILAATGFNPQGMPRFLQKLEQISDNKNADITEYLQSHPLPHKRVVDAQLRANQLGRSGGKENMSYQYMREKVRMLVRPENPPSPKASPRVKKYAAALKHEKRGRYAQALQLVGLHSKQVWEVVLIARALNKQRKFQQSIQLLTPLLKVYPANEFLSMPLAEAYAGLNQPQPLQQAWNVLKRVVISEQTSLEFFELRQRIANRSGHRAEAYRSAAERNLRMGEYKYAAVQLRQAIKLPDANVAQLHQFQGLLTKVETHQAREKSLNK